MTTWQFWILIVVLVGLGSDRNWTEKRLFQNRLDRVIQLLTEIRDRLH